IGRTGRFDSLRSLNGRERTRDSAARRPPVAQALLRGILPDDALVQAQVEQKTVGLADLAPRRDAEDPLDLVAIELRADRLELLLLAQRGDPLLKVVVRAGQPGRLALVARGHIC